MIHALRHWLVPISLLKILRCICVEGRKWMWRLTKGFSSRTCFSGQYLLPQPGNLIRGLMLEGSQSPDCKCSLSRLLLDAWTELRFPWGLSRILTNSSFPCWRKINRNHLMTPPPWSSNGLRSRAEDRRWNQWARPEVSADDQLPAFRKGSLSFVRLGCEQAQRWEQRYWSLLSPDSPWSLVKRKVKGRRGGKGKRGQGRRTEDGEGVGPREVKCSDPILHSSAF